jgi:hypothetical protein
MLLPLIGGTVRDAGAQSDSIASAAGEFHFARLIYTDRPERARYRNGWWMQDWPYAEQHFFEGLQRLTRIDAGEPVAIELTDERLFDYPWLYATQTGYWDLSDEEILRLREYLLRGGFLMTDDFFGDVEWAVFSESMTRLFPERPLVAIPANDELLHVLYDIDQFTQIPGRRHIGCNGGGFRGGRARRGSRGTIDTSYLPAPEWKGIYDDDGRLMLAANFNQDVGDAWEHADDACYPEPMTALAYRFGINYLIYSMSH